MTKIWILIIVIKFGGGVVTQEFYGEKACREAEGYVNSFTDLAATCIPKGSVVRLKK
jgi:hypothetical protein